MSSTPTIQDWRTPVRLDCGHMSTPREWNGNSGLPGYATERATDRRICYSCADANERNALKTATRYTAYLTPIKNAVGHVKGHALTTWTGGHLANVRVLTKGHCNIGRTTLYRFQAIDIHGQHWYGTSPGPQMYAHMHKNKRQPNGRTA